MPLGRPAERHRPDRDGRWPRRADRQCRSIPRATRRGSCMCRPKARRRWQPGDHVTLELDWDRRYRLMRMHTALHLLSVVFPFPVTGGSIGEDKGRLDFDMPEVPADLAGARGAAQRHGRRPTTPVTHGVDHRRRDGGQSGADQDDEGQAADGPGPRPADPHRRCRPAALRRHACRATRPRSGR